MWSRGVGLGCSLWTPDLGALRAAFPPSGPLHSPCVGAGLPSNKGGQVIQLIRGISKRQKKKQRLRKREHIVEAT